MLHVQHMRYKETVAKMIQIRNVPERVHRELVRRAKARGQTLSDFLTAVLEREIAIPDEREVFERIARLEPIDLGDSSAIIRAGRDERARELDNAARGKRRRA